MHAGGEKSLDEKVTFCPGSYLLHYESLLLLENPDFWKEKQASDYENDRCNICISK